eukprot:2764327-Amphidinium_carterae.1
MCRVVLGETQLYPVLHVCVDQGSVGWAGLQYACTKLRITLTGDVFHRRHNDFLLALGDAECVNLRLAFKTLCRLQRAPWGSDANLAEMRSCARHLFELHTPGHPVFQWLLQDIAREVGAEHKDRELSAAEELQVWESLKGELMSQPLGPECTTTRWFNFEVVSRHLAKRRHRTQLVLIVLGMLRGWWTPSTCPLVQERRSDEADSGEPLKENGELDSSVDEVRKNFLQKRYGQLRYAAELLCREGPCRLWQALATLSIVLERPFFSLMPRLKNVESATEWMLEQASGAEQQIFESLQWPLSAEYMHESSLDKCDLAENIVRDIWKKIWEVSRGVAGEVGKTSLLFRTPPLSFLALLARDEAESTCAMARLRREYERLMELEDLSRSDGTLADWLKELTVNEHVFVREVFIRLRD